MIQPILQTARWFHILDSLFELIAYAPHAEAGGCNQPSHSPIDPEILCFSVGGVVDAAIWTGQVQDRGQCS